MKAMTLVGLYTMSSSKQVLCPLVLMLIPHTQQAAAGRQLGTECPALLLLE
jgi:hypothetical protein